MHTKSIIFVASLFGMAVSAGCSSSSSPAAPGNDGGGGDDSGGGDDGSASSSSGGTSDAGDGGLAVMLSCASAMDCKTAGQVCCGTYTPPMTVGTSCQAGPCPALTTPLGSFAGIQICKLQSECTGGATCGAPTGLLGSFLMGMQVCNAPAEGGAPEGGTEGGSSSGGTEGGSDAPAE